MFKYYKIYILIFFCSFFLSFKVFAYNLENAFQLRLLGVTGSGADYSWWVSSPDPIISTIIQSALSLLGVIFIILMIYGGGLWMTARGDEQKVEKAKNLITAAVIGLVIVVLAYAITYFVVRAIGGGNIKNLEGQSSP